MRTFIKCISYAAAQELAATITATTELVAVVTSPAIEIYGVTIHV